VGISRPALEKGGGEEGEEDEEGIRSKARPGIAASRSAAAKPGLPHNFFSLFLQWHQALLLGVEIAQSRVLEFNLRIVTIPEREPTIQ
jgi:hypothetical protein